MAQAPKTVFTYPLKGTQRDFPIAFEYLARKFVRVTLLGANARKELVLNTDYRFTTKVQITTTQAWGAAEGYDTIEIRRYTSAEERLVDFNDGSILRAFDLNLSQIQTLHVAEEARDLTADTIGVNQDGNLDARGRKIVNLANGINATDAANVGQLRQYDNSTANNADRAEAAKNRAVQAETNTARDSASAAVNATKAVASAGTAVKAASDANRSYEKIVPLEQSTVANAKVATQQAQRAKNEADRAKSEADKLANINEFANTLHDVSSLRPQFKEAIDIGLEGNHAYMAVCSKKDGESAATRKGYVGIAAPNSIDITLGSYNGAAGLRGSGTTLNVAGSQVWTNGYKLNINHQKTSNQSYIDLWGNTTALRLHSDDASKSLLLLNTDGALDHKFASFSKVGSGRGNVKFDNNTVSTNMLGSNWTEATSLQNAGVYVSNSSAAQGHAYAALSANYTGRAVGWSTNIGLGTLMHDSPTVLSPYLWAACTSNNHFRVWKFDADTGRLEYGSMPSGTSAKSLNQNDFKPRGAPNGEVGVNGLGMIQWRYGTASTSTTWTWVAFSSPFPTGVLAVIVTSLNATGSAWPHRVGSWNNTGFNVTGGPNEPKISYIALGY